MMIVGFTRLCSGELFGLGQGDANGLPAYSSVSQMGFLSLCVGAGVMAWPALPTVIFYALHQALDKNALFLRVGARCSPGDILTATGKLLSMSQNPVKVKEDRT